MDTRKSKRRRLQSSTEIQRLASMHISAPQRPRAQPKVDDEASNDMTIMARPISIHLNYSPPPTICMDSETSIRPVTLNEIKKHEDVKECPVCFEDFGQFATNKDGNSALGHQHHHQHPNTIVATPCEHYFHRHCLLESLKHSTKCPICRKSVAAPRGKCPPATMSVSLKDSAVYSCHGLTPQLIQITYMIPSGIQAPYHEAPGLSFSGASRVAYLQNDVESRRLLQRLCFAFMHGLTFAVGTSLTSGAPNTVTWASIHHKTNIGRTSFALPDPSYVHNCNDELDNLNVPPTETCGPYF